jgi:AraC-like DNA-binding protein
MHRALRPCRPDLPGAGFGPASSRNADVAGSEIDDDLLESGLHVPGSHPALRDDESVARMKFMPRAMRLACPSAASGYGTGPGTASGMALRETNLTDAAISAGFSDSAHFSRLHRETFGVTPSYILGRLARATIAAQGRAALKQVVSLGRRTPQAVRAVEGHNRFPGPHLRSRTRSFRPSCPWRDTRMRRRQTRCRQQFQQPVCRA